MMRRLLSKESVAGGTVVESPLPIVPLSLMNPISYIEFFDEENEEKQQTDSEALKVAAKKEQRKQQNETHQAPKKEKQQIRNIGEAPKKEKQQIRNIGEAPKKEKRQNESRHVHQLTGEKTPQLQRHLTRPDCNSPRARNSPSPQRSTMLRNTMKQRQQYSCDLYRLRHSTKEVDTLVESDHRRLSASTAASRHSDGSGENQREFVLHSFAKNEPNGQSLPSPFQRSKKSLSNGLFLPVRDPPKMVSEVQTKRKSSQGWQTLRSATGPCNALSSFSLRDLEAQTFYHSEEGRAFLQGAETHYDALLNAQAFDAYVREMNETYRCDPSAFLCAAGYGAPIPMMPETKRQFQLRSDPKTRGSSMSPSLQKPLFSQPGMAISPITPELLSRGQEILSFFGDVYQESPTALSVTSVKRFHLERSSYTRKWLLEQQVDPSNEPAVPLPAVSSAPDLKLQLLRGRGSSGGARSLNYESQHHTSSNDESTIGKSTRAASMNRAETKKNSYPFAWTAQTSVRGNGFVEQSQDDRNGDFVNFTVLRFMKSPERTDRNCAKIGDPRNMLAYFDHFEAFRYLMSSREKPRHPHDDSVNRKFGNSAGPTKSFRKWHPVEGEDFQPATPVPSWHLKTRETRLHGQKLRRFDDKGRPVLYFYFTGSNAPNTPPHSRRNSHNIKQPQNSAKGKRNGVRASSIPSTPMRELTSTGVQLPLASSPESSSSVHSASRNFFHFTLFSNAKSRYSSGPLSPATQSHSAPPLLADPNDILLDFLVDLLDRSSSSWCLKPRVPHISIIVNLLEFSGNIRLQPLKEFCSIACTYFSKILHISFILPSSWLDFSNPNFLQHDGPLLREPVAPPLPPPHPRSSYRCFTGQFAKTFRRILSSSHHTSASTSSAGSNTRTFLTSGSSSGLLDATPPSASHSSPPPTTASIADQSPPSPSASADFSLCTASTKSKSSRIQSCIRCHPSINTIGPTDFRQQIRKTAPPLSTAVCLGELNRDLSSFTSVVDVPLHSPSLPEPTPPLSSPSNCIETPSASSFGYGRFITLTCRTAEYKEEDAVHSNNHKPPTSRQASFPLYEHAAAMRGRGDNKVSIESLVGWARDHRDA